MNKVYIVLFDTGYYEMIDSVFSTEERAIKRAEASNAEFNKNKINPQLASKRYYVCEMEVDGVE
jgi:hypothetical protein